MKRLKVSKILRLRTILSIVIFLMPPMNASFAQTKEVTEDTVELDSFMANQEFLLSVPLNKGDENNNGIRDDVDFVIANQGDFTEKEKDLARVFAQNLTQIVESSTRDPLFLYSRIYFKSQVHWCFEDASKLNNVETILLDSFDKFSRNLEAYAIFSRSKFRNIYYDIDISCHYSELKALSVESGIPYHEYVESKREQLFEKHLEEINKNKFPGSPR